MIVCCLCRKAKEPSEYYGDRTKRSGRSSRCKPCEADYNRQPSRLAQRREWASGRRYVHYSLKQEDVDGMRWLQDDCCASCGDRFSADPVVDHDHACCGYGRSCGKCVRGLLCAPCNLVLGHAKDNPSRLRSAALYLERSAA